VTAVLSTRIAVAPARTVEQAASQDLANAMPFRPTLARPPLLLDRLV
jgi:hypothetical protein